MEENERKARQERERCQSIILQQIEDGKAKKITETKYKREIPDIAGSQGYPPIFEPSPVQQRTLVVTSYQHQKDALIKQVKR